MSIAHSTPSPREVFGTAETARAKKLYDEAVTSVIEQCKNRLRRGVAAHSVTVMLRNQYVLRLAPLAAGVEILQDAALDHTAAGPVLDVTEHGASSKPAAGGAARVEAGTVRYSPFGNAAPRPVSRKKAQA